MKKPGMRLSPLQIALPLTIAKEVEIDGIGMGVLSDGTPYLTGRGLANMCGIDQKQIVRLTAGWNVDPQRPRETKIKENLKQQGITLFEPYIKITVAGSVHYAFPDTVCMAVLEYYAFDAGNDIRPQARKNYRLLARKTFRDFIYSQVGYTTANAIPEVWRQFHDRVTLVYDNVPPGFFSVFKEMADIIVSLIREGGPVGPHFVPDISVGIHWGKHWRDNYLDGVYGQRLQYEHDYPPYFPQAASNPQTPYCYPDRALGAFRQWMREVYLVDKYPGYIGAKIKKGELIPSFADAALRAIANRATPKRLS